MGPSITPGGKIFIGRATLRVLIEFAYSVEKFQVSGGPDWVRNDIFDVTILCPSVSVPTFAHGSSFRLSAAQRSILRDLLESRFHLKLRKTVTNGPILLLQRGTGPLGLTPTVKPEREAATAVFQKGTIADGEAFGINVSLDLVAKEFAEELQQIVVNQTGLQGSYDFHVLPFAKENTDMEFAVKGVAMKLGLVLKKSKGAYDVLQIESATLPDAN
jgi:uncharacterized protein (TIGR03435 family)